MNEFISKYYDFKIKDDKGQVYPLHIARALHQGCPDPDLVSKKIKENSLFDGDSND